MNIDCMMVSKELFLTAGKFNESFLHHYFDVDFSQRLIRNITKKVKFHPAAVMLFNENTVSENSQDDDLEHADTKRDLAIFQENYGTVLHEEITDRYQVKNFTVVWNMECGTGQVSARDISMTRVILTNPRRFSASRPRRQDSSWV